MARAPRKQVAGHMAVLAGGAAGLTEILIMYPLDTVKTRKMLQVDGVNLGVIRTIKDIISIGGTRALYRGILPPICMEAPKRAVKFGVNDTVHPILLKLTGATSMTQGIAIVAGACGGIFESGIVAPFEKVKIRMQDAKNLGRYTSSVDCFRKTIASEGLLAFAKGMQATVYCQGIWSAGYFGTIYRVRKAAWTPKTLAEELVIDLMAGFTGGLIGTVLNTPFDVVKSRVQNMETKRNSKVPNTFIVLADIARREGVSAWYKGFKPKVLRLAPGGGILLALFEQAKATF
ncbi:hypothetical protein V500_01839 [Pseudogymnoascus sp. VKM F-4518 (FW-2643)]|nr:hypothetical protein V500_01839 [Pseudogymnoascus sp. VKM F-4518 (FW-2643)]